MRSSEISLRKRATGKLVLGLGALAVSAGCLVTEKFEFAATDTLPVVRAISPPTFTRVPSISDPDCANAMRFDATVIERDLGQLVYIRTATNGDPDNNVQQASPDALGSELRKTRIPLCAPKSKLNRPCNRVQMLVSNDLESLLAWPMLQPELVVVLEWTVLGQAGEVPEARPSDCEQLMVRDDGGIPPIRRDGGL